MAYGKRVLLFAWTALVSGVAPAQDGPVLAVADLRAPPVLDVVSLAGLPERVFDALLEAYEASSYYAGSVYDVTYDLGETGKLTVQFFEGKAGFFRLITRQACPSAEALPGMLGVDVARLRLAEDLGVKKVWKGRLGDGVTVEAAAVYSPSGWTTAVVRVAGPPDD